MLVSGLAGDGFVVLFDYFPGFDAVYGGLFACKCEVGRAVFVVIGSIVALLCSHGFEQGHEKPALFDGEALVGNGVERGNRFLH